MYKVVISVCLSQILIVEPGRTTGILLSWFQSYKMIRLTLIGKVQFHGKAGFQS